MNVNDFVFRAVVQMDYFVMEVVVINTHMNHVIDGYEHRYVGINNLEADGEPQTSNRIVYFRHFQRRSRADTEVGDSCLRSVYIHVSATCMTVGVVLYLSACTTTSSASIDDNDFEGVYEPLLC